jgi:phage terminase large subunit-like protein
MSLSASSCTSGLRRSGARGHERDRRPAVTRRLIPASDRLYRAVIEKRITHPNDPALNAHVAHAIARDTPRGWRIDKPHGRAQIDALIALAMAVERAEQPVPKVELVGWL